jgi:hypothetical protein
LSTASRNRALLACLQDQRAHVLGIIEGLDDEVLRQPVLPTGWSCHGMVRHLTVDIERFWFRAVVAGERSVIDDLASAAADGWHLPDGLPAAAVLESYRHEAACADEIIATTSLDAAPAWWPGDLFGSWRLDDLEEIVLHVIAETACHAGHLDVARELIDGRTWRVV